MLPIGFHLPPGERLHPKIKKERISRTLPSVRQEGSMLKKFFLGAMFALTLAVVTPASTMTVHAGFTSEDEGGSSESSSSDSGSSDSGSSDSGSSDSGSSDSGSSDSGSSDSGSSDSGSSDSGSSDEGGSSEGEGSSESGSEEGGSSDEGTSSNDGQDSSDEGGNEAPSADPEPSEETPAADPEPSEEPAPETDADDGSHDNGGSHHSDSSSSSSSTPAVVVEEPVVITEQELPVLAIPVLPVVEEVAAVEPVAAEELAVAEAPVAKAAAVQEEEVYSCTYSGVRRIADEPEMIPEEDNDTEVVVVPEEEPVANSDLLALLAILGIMAVIALFVLSDQYEVVLVTEDGEEIVDDEAPVVGFRRIVRYVAGLDFDDEEFSDKLDDVVRVEIRNRYRDKEDDPEQNIVYGFTREGDEYTVYCSDKEGLVLYDELGFDYKAALEAAVNLSDSKANPGAMPA